MKSNYILIILLAFLWLPLSLRANTPIRGTQEADAETMFRFVAERNPAFDRSIAEAFHEVGETYGIRGDIALCQAIIETGWFRFDNGTAVSADAHNYCGLGVHTRGEKGCSFATLREGVTAMIQHLYAYSCQDPLPEGETVTDPRFKFVRRGSAPTWESLSGKWAMNENYGNNILRLYARLQARTPRPEEPQRASRKATPDVWADIPYVQAEETYEENIQNLFK
ncbi:MAG: glucosaminidase domain-containing protein [Duncaniella sp.]|nr:glucosaminidase domain-containing protein [Duncaniella sp.]